MNKHTPMEIRAARILSDRVADQCGVDRDDNWNIYSEDFKADAKAILDGCAAPDLLDVLVRAKSAIEALDGTTAENEKLLDDYRAAIAKATGAA
jgi:hypothetical protein